ncbi:MAG: Phenylacetic acid catabolic protein, partial [Ignavibacteria bacterium]
MKHNTEQLNAIKDLIFRMADDQLILGHRNSEWTGLGPILEEDIAFSSMAQDKLGHSQALFQILSRMGETDPDSLAFGRKENKMKCCHLVEYPIGEYDFSLMRHFLFDESEALRFDMLRNS